MTHVATLVCDPSFPSLTEAVLHAALNALPRVNEHRWLDKGIAADIFFEPEALTEPRELAEKVRAALAGASIDVIVQATQGRRKKLFLADMDSTMIGQECIDELAAEAGKKPQIAAITERAMRGEIEFEPALRERVALLKNLPQNAMHRVLAKRITLTPGGRILVQTLRRDGVHCMLVSSGFSIFAAAVAEKTGFHEYRANTLLIGEDGRLTGDVAEPVLARNAKFEALVEAREKLGLAASETLAVGDGANDLAMIEAAGLGIAFRAKPLVAAAAHARIDHADLTGLLFAQGYAREEFFAEPRAQLNPADWKRKYGAMEKAHERGRY